MPRKTKLMIVACALAAMASAQPKPFGLMTDLIERTDVVYVNGYPNSDVTNLDAIAEVAHRHNVKY